MTDQQRAIKLFEKYRNDIHCRTDLMFGALLVLQLIAGLLAAIFISPRSWAGSQSTIHIHIWGAIALGLCFTSVPLLLIYTQRGKPITRYTIAIAQMLFSALLIHLTAGRIETHFHVFGSLAFLAFYRDWRVLVPATIVVAADHLFRGIFWPQSVFGVLSTGIWRAFEHAGWVIFEDIFLVYSCIVGSRELRTIATTQIGLEEAREHVEQKVLDRTSELNLRTVELRSSEERFELAVLGSRDGLWDWNLITNKVYYAPQWKELVGCGNDEIGDSPEDWFSRIVSGSLAEFDESLTAFREGRLDYFDVEIGMHHSDGRVRWMRCRAAAVRDTNGVALRLAGSLNDITDLREMQEQLRKLAQHDRLTGLPNRDLFVDRVQRAIVRARRDPDHRFAVLFFDFDRFKVINDSFGHNVGDLLLKSIANRLSENVREVDTPARFGGDEFVVLLDGIAIPRDVAAKADQLVQIFSMPHVLNGHEVISTASIGVVTSGPEYVDAEEMIRDADAAMYQAKSNGKAQYRIFDAAMHANAAARLTIEQELRLAVDTDQLALWYQPIVCLSTGAITGVEGLLRWKHPTKGMISPDQFIQIAEETGLIIPIGTRVIHDACRQIKHWQSAGAAPLYVNVNVSRRQLVHPDLIPTLRNALNETSIDPARLRIEITESAVMDSRFDVVSIMQQIKDLGVLLAMDDFGTGYSSLSCLHTFPVDVLKIDRTFIQNMTKRREFSAVMHAIITLAQHLKLHVVAEGVETPDQLAQLQAMDCNSAQGYLFSRPVPAGDIPALLVQGLSIPLAA